MGQNGPSPKWQNIKHLNGLRLYSTFIQGLYKGCTTKYTHDTAYQ